jgi:hypothetical protein
MGKEQEEEKRTNINNGVEDTPQKFRDKAFGEFQSMLWKTGMQFNQPDGFSSVPVIENDEMYYMHSIKSDTHKLEIRYHIVPLESPTANFNEIKTVNRSGGDYNDMYAMNMVATASNISAGGLGKVSPFPEDAVKSEFGADWGATLSVPLRGTSFGKDYKICMITTIHKNNCADAFICYLYNDMNEVGDLIMDNFYSLTFSQ